MGHGGRYRDGWRREEVGRGRQKRARLHPSFLKKHRAKSTDSTVSPNYRPELRGPKTDPLGKVAEMPTKPQSGQTDEKADPLQILWKTPLPMRGFGEFRSAIGIGSYGVHLSQTLRCSSDGEKGISLGANANSPSPIVFPVLQPA